MTTLVELVAAKPQRLYHFCCQHSRRAIGTYGLLIPQIEHPLLGCRVVWLTTEAEPDRHATGLANETGLLHCDRMEYRYVVSDLERARTWLQSPERAAAPPQAVADLESYGDAQHWWIANEPIRAKLDKSWQPQ